MIKVLICFSSGMEKIKNRVTMEIILNNAGLPLKAVHDVI